MVYASWLGIIPCMRRRCRVDCTWTPELAYAVGIFASDGNLSPDGRHLNITSKDLEMIENMKALLGLDNKIGRKSRGGSLEKKYFLLQFGDRNFYDFLLSIGLTPAKSKTIAEIAVPEIYFFDFFRGCVDGDGSIDSFMHSESKHPQIRLRLCSASIEFLDWVLSMTRKLGHINGGFISQRIYRGVHILSYGKADALKLLQLMYYAEALPALSRKRIVAEGFLGRVAELV
jgi:hypothetical protein